jgi:NTP pyrophosphatase (non-canonical NTP hydrolase)
MKMATSSKPLKSLDYRLSVNEEHKDLVFNLVKPGSDVIRDLTPESANLLHLASALCGESGELFDPIKKTAIYGKPLDLTNIREELGDIEFYLEGIRSALRITREETLQANIDKLSVRYASQKFTNEDAINRADKDE